MTSMAFRSRFPEPRREPTGEHPDIEPQILALVFASSSADPKSSETVLEDPFSTAFRPEASFSNAAIHPF
jgi:hypothetical protein